MSVNRSIRTTVYGVPDHFYYPTVLSASNHEICCKVAALLKECSLDVDI